MIEVRNAPQIFVRRERNYLGDLGMDRRVILKWSIRE
jgi:hypothetical protein